MKEETVPEQFALCLDNAGYKAALEVGKLYRVISDAEAEQHGYLRIVDESGEDYAYTETRFHLMTLPLPVEKSLLMAIRA
ncbi:MAG TPA: hypothetical protein PLD20_03415 [Blastocatellia bacterium]|nr:hypothetical protein [Blastocatellia bacterium]HMV82746.1 hypothetical protein [Blastocatellia bacterium]HMY76806.1 hypothetical protein [Blastocatellia bacterium]HMZ16951.1 hypothetical protein [Blastocatellia bacterium]HNG34439.1 hypothetical protein [Blastocatellia bacterium]